MLQTLQKNNSAIINLRKSTLKMNGGTLLKKIFQLISLSFLCFILFPNTVLAENQQLYKYIKNPDGSYGYNQSSPVPLYNGSSELIQIPSEYQQPKNQFRSSWVATINNLNIAKPSSEADFKANYTKILSDFSDWNMNAMIFQVRPLLDAYYPSELNPWSEFLSGSQGADPGYDPLAWMVETTHQAGMEYHAWFNPYRVTNTKLSTQSILTKTGLTKEEILSLSIPEQITALHNAGILAATNYAVEHPENVLIFDEKLFLNPGIPAVRDYVVASIAEVVQNYDVDAIHFDDYFYPYRITVDGVNVLFGEKGEDDATFAEFGAGYTSIDDWRRDNITSLVEGIKQVIDVHNQQNQKAVQFGISPFGIWEHKANDNRGSNTPTGSSQSYSTSIYADTYKWIKEETLDYVIPQIYWSFDQSAAPYGELTKWWNDVAEGSKTQIYVGHANYKHISNGGWDASWMNPEEIPNQMRFNQTLPNISGSSLFSYNDISLSNVESLPPDQQERHRAKNASIEQLKTTYFNLPALLPAKPWLTQGTLSAPTSVNKNIENPDAPVLTWQDSETNPARYYVLYRGVGSAIETVSNPASIVAKIWRTPGENTFSYTDTRLPQSGTAEEYYISAIDAAGNESDPTLLTAPEIIIEPQQGATVTVLYLDEKQVEIAEKEQLIGVVDTEYNSVAKKIDGYTLLSQPANTNGVFTDSEQTVIYQYKKDTTITVIEPEIKPVLPVPEEKQETATVIPDKSHFIPGKKQENKEKTDLPSTGETELVTLSFLGSIVTLTILYWFFKRKYQNAN